MGMCYKQLRQTLAEVSERIKYLKERHGQFIPVVICDCADGQRHPVPQLTNSGYYILFCTNCGREAVVSVKEAPPPPL